MPGPVTITVRVKLHWAKVEADGQECEHCGDKIYLFDARQVVFEFISDGKASKRRTGAFFCQSCFDELAFDMPR